MEGGLQSHREHNEDMCTRRRAAEERHFKQARAGRRQVGSGLRHSRGDAAAGDGRGGPREGHGGSEDKGWMVRGGQGFGREGGCDDKLIQPVSNNSLLINCRVRFFFFNQFNQVNFLFILVVNITVVAGKSKSAVAAMMVIISAVSHS